MVGVHVRETHCGRGEPEVVGKQLVLSALAGINEDAVASPGDEDATNCTVASWLAGACAEHMDIEVHFLALVVL